jgi:hypothetical protein
MNDRHRAMVRIALGFAQVFAAAFAGVLVFRVGIGPASCLAVLVACLLTVISMLVFRERR